MPKHFLRNLLSLILIVFLFSSISAQERKIINEEFKKVNDEYNLLTMELNRLRNEISKAGEAGNAELYNKLKVAYDKISADIKKYEKIRLDFINVNEIYNDGNRAFKLGNNKEALDKYNEAIKKGMEVNSPALNETISLAYYQIGLIMKSDKRYKESIEAYNNSIKYAPNYEKGYFALGNTYKDMDNFDLAIYNYLKTIEIDSSFYQAYFSLGTVYIDQWSRISESEFGKKEELLDKAESAFRDVMRINPKYYLAFTYLGRILVETKRPVEAIETLNKAVSIEKNYWQHYYYLAVAYNQLNDPKGAKENAENCLKFRKNFTPAFMEIGDAYKQLGDDNKAIEYYSKGLNDRIYRKLAEYKIDMIKNKDKYEQ